MPNFGQNHRLNALCIVVGLAALTNLVDGFVIGSGGTSSPLWLNSAGTSIINYLCLISYYFPDIESAPLVLLKRGRFTYILYMCSLSKMLPICASSPQRPIVALLPCLRHLEMAQHLPPLRRWYLHEPKSTSPGPSPSGSSVASLVASRYLWAPTRLANHLPRATWDITLPNSTLPVLDRCSGTKSHAGI